MATFKTAVEYLPVLKWKQGEQGAVKPLSLAMKSRMLPIAELQDRTYDWEKGLYKKTWNEHLDKLALTTKNAWGKIHEIAVDMNSEFMPNLSKKSRHRHFAKLWEAGVQAVPVIGNYTSLPERMELFGVASQYGKSRWLLRYSFLEESEDLPSAAEVARWFHNAVKDLGLDHRQVDAAVDLGHVGQWNVGAVAPAVAEIVSAVSSLGQWRRVAMLCGAFPTNLAGLTKGLHPIPRTDWELYGAVHKQLKDAPVKPLYGDYGVSHVKAFEGDPRMLKMSVNLRYADWTAWTVFKAGSAVVFGFDQYLDLCRLLISLPVYKGQSFSQGDENYYEKATDPDAGPGNASIWRRDATNHHLHMVLHQLSSLTLP